MWKVKVNRQQSTDNSQQPTANSQWLKCDHSLRYRCSNKCNLSLNHNHRCKHALKCKLHSQQPTPLP